MLLSTPRLWEAQGGTMILFLWFYSSAQPSSQDTQPSRPIPSPPLQNAQARTLKPLSSPGGGDFLPLSFPAGSAAAEPKGKKEPARPGLQRGSGLSPDSGSGLADCVVCLNLHFHPAEQAELKSSSKASMIYTHKATTQGTGQRSQLPARPSRSW